MIKAAQTNLVLNYTYNSVCIFLLHSDQNFNYFVINQVSTYVLNNHPRTRFFLFYLS